MQSIVRLSRRVGLLSNLESGVVSMHWAITGGTGFVGVHVLSELLRGSGTFTLLTRPRSDSLARLQKALAAIGGQLWTAEYLRERLAIVPVDFGEPNLGLPDQNFRALADSLDAILHCAGSTELDGDIVALRRVNVDGTARILELAQAGSRAPDLFHMSSAFVAGARRTGVVYETDFDDDSGFENTYERSKFEAESLVRDWAQRTGRRVVVLRPGALVSDRPPDPDFPLHPLSYLSKTAEAALRLLAMSGRPLNTTLQFRLRGDPKGHLNYMPVGEAAEAMVRLLQLAPAGLSTYHVVHHHDVAVQMLVDLFNAVSPFRGSLVEGAIEDPNFLERRMRWAKGFIPYLQHSRTFDTTGARTLLGEPSRQTVVDFNYLLAGVGPYKRHFSVNAAQQGSRQSARATRPVARVAPQFPVRVRSADTVRPMRGLTFIVTVGRSGSTALSRVLSGHRDVLSLNEFYVSVRTSLPLDQPLSGEEFWRSLAEPHPVFDAMVRGGSGMPEFIYPRLEGTRFDAYTTGIPAISMMTLPHLSPDPDGVFDALAAEVATWPQRTARVHYERLFEWLAARFGGSVVVERSAMSLSSVPWLRETFPDAKFVHLFRHGPDTAVSMSQHTGFRLMALIQDALELLDLETESRNPGLRLDPAALPIELAPLVGDRCDLDFLMGQHLPVTRFAQMWSESIAIGVTALADLPADRYIPLSYSDLVADPRSCLTRLAAFLDVEADPKWLEFGASVIDPKFAGGSNRLSGEDLQAVVDGCATGEALLRGHAIAPSAKETTAACFRPARSDTAIRVDASDSGFGINATERAPTLLPDEQLSPAMG
jgi:thioester reductase-like protein